MEKIVIIGAGNVANHLAKNLRTQNVEILQIVNRTKKRAKALANKIGINFTTDYKSINQNADLYILALSDDVIASVGEKLAKVLPKDAFVVHTSGATSSKVLKPAFKNYGVFYPLQTFSLANLETLDFTEVPICIDAPRKELRTKLEGLGKKLSKKVCELSDEERAKVHVAAVFANNFSNLMFSISESILEEEELDFEILKPLIKETVNKIKDNKAKDMQTGPARRGDQETIKKHLDFLAKYPAYQKLYKELSKTITNT